MAESINPRNLDARQLEALKKQLTEIQITLLTSNFNELKSAQSKFQSSINVVEGISTAGEPIDTLIPMTSSLYIPGQYTPGSNILVDIGAGYFVSKSPKDAIEIFEKKSNTLKKNTTDLMQIIAGRQQNLDYVTQILNEKTA